jgi:hypothetical protein
MRRRLEPGMSNREVARHDDPVVVSAPRHEEGERVARSYWGLTPRESIEAECARRGRQAVVDGCARLVTSGEADAALIVALGGPAARGLLDASLPKGQLYWLRVWGARGLLWVWDDSALGALRVALEDEAWRVREMAAKVVARNRLGDALACVAALQDDPVPRVRDAASRAVTVLTAAGT